MSGIASKALRGVMIVLGAIVLGLSVTLAKIQVVGSPPAETTFFSFAGAFGIIVGAIGILAIFIDKIPRVGLIVADTLASIFYLAGAIALTIALKPVSSCTSRSDVARTERFNNKLLNGGCITSKDGPYCYAGSANDPKHFDSYTTGRCQQVQADYVFGYIAFICGVASVVLNLLTLKRGGSTTTSTTYV